jgi:hypothetical protein
MKELKSDLSTSDRASPEMMPEETDWPTPNGFPMASTMSPTCTPRVSA